MLCILTSERMLGHGFGWSKTTKNIQKLWKNHLFHHAHKRLTTFSSFLNVFCRFQPCERMRKHTFAGQNTQHLSLLKNAGLVLYSLIKLLFDFFQIFSTKTLKMKILTSIKGGRNMQQIHFYL